jgi:hypothetical protein
MKVEGKFSFTFNREHWVWVDRENKYVSRGMQPLTNSTTTTTTTTTTIVVDLVVMVIDLPSVVA